MTLKAPKTLAQVDHLWDGQVLMTTTRGAADLLGVSITTIRNWIRDGRIAGIRFLPNGRRYLPVRELWRDAPPVEVAEQIERMREGAQMLRNRRVEQGKAAPEADADARTVLVAAAAAQQLADDLEIPVDRLLQAAARHVKGRTE